MAEADAVKARMEAEAIGIERRAAALSQNQEAVIAQQIAENLPEIVRAAASPFEHVGTFTVLNGAEGVTGALAEIIQQAGALTKMARETLMPTIPSGASGNGRSADGATPGHEDIAVTTAPIRERSRSRSQAETSAASKGESSGRGT
jgi:uncharacterized membrane protein YqiK